MDSSTLSPAPKSVEKIIDGKAIALAVKGELAIEVAAASQGKSRKPGLAVVLVGENPASKAYVKSKIAACKAVGIESFLIEMAADVPASAVAETVQKLNLDQAVDGILVQLPLPGHISSATILALIDPAKDVDGLTAVNAGLLMQGAKGLFPCTPLGVMRLLEQHNVSLKGKQAVVVGRSHLVGKPLAMMLLQKDATVTICHSKTANLPEVCRQADVLVAACGQAEMVKGDWVKPGAVVIDVGINRVETADGKGRLVGDVAYDEAFEKASLITPVPGGVGPMTVAMLLSNTLRAYNATMTSVI
ncbi:MAG: bifunctional methylenetetrahydrofolate dehydrogenase/methenyltetrahydrofolate cyclohydrolase FolD [Candidatus Obscuribacterales bacterium]